MNLGRRAKIALHSTMAMGYMQVVLGIYSLVSTSSSRRLSSLLICFVKLYLRVKSMHGEFTYLIFSYIMCQCGSARSIRVVL